MPNVRQRAAARRDLVEHFIYLAENAGLDTAERFLANGEATFNNLAGQPMIGTPLASQHPAAGWPAKIARQGIRKPFDLLPATI
jgi:toxin ParE1/3/4